MARSKKSYSDLEDENEILQARVSELEQWISDQVDDASDILSDDSDDEE